MAPVSAVDVQPDQIPAVLDRLQATLDAATPPPWWREGENEYIYGNERGGRPNGEGIAQARYYSRHREDGPADAALIVAAVNALPALIAYGRKLWQMYGCSDHPNCPRNDQSPALQAFARLLSAFPMED